MLGLVPVEWAADQFPQGFACRQTGQRLHQMRQDGPDHGQYQALARNLFHKSHHRLCRGRIRKFKRGSQNHQWRYKLGFPKPAHDVEFQRHLFPGFHHRLCRRRQRHCFEIRFPDLLRIGSRLSYKSCSVLCRDCHFTEYSHYYHTIHHVLYHQSHSSSRINIQYQYRCHFRNSRDILTCHHLYGERLQWFFIHIDHVEYYRAGASIRSHLFLQSRNLWNRSGHYPE